MCLQGQGFQSGAGGITIFATEPIFILSNSWEMAFQSIPSGFLWSSQGGARLQGWWREDLCSHTPQGCLILLGQVAACPWVLVVSGAPCICHGVTGLISCRARSRWVPTAVGLPIAPPDMRPLDSSLLVPEILGGFFHSAGGSSLAL